MGVNSPCQFILLSYGPVLRERRAGADKETKGLLLTAYCLPFASFLIQLSATCLGIVLPTVGWAHSHQSTDTVPHRLNHRAI